MSGLRAELLGETLPEWSMAIPDGWERYAPGDETRDRLLREGRARLMAAHRPDLYAQLVDSTNQAFREMGKLETVALFLPGAAAVDAAFLPASLTAVVRRGPNGASLDDEIAHLVRSRGATALDEDKRFLRWRNEDAQRFGDTRVATTTIVYLTPVPGTGRRRALQFTLVITHDPGAPGDAEFVEGLATYFDAHLATFEWRRS